MLKRHPIILNCVWMLILLALPLPLVAILDSSLLPAAISQLLPIDAGVTAYVWWLAAVALSTRPRWIDRIMGLPKMYLIHSLLGIGALLLAFLHRHFLMTMGRWIALAGNTAWYLALFGLTYALLMLSGLLVDRFTPASKLKHRLETVFNHQISVWVHRLNLVAILAIWLHVHLIGRISIHFWFITLFDLYTVAALGCYCWAKFRGPAKYLHGTIVENRELSPQTQRLVLDFGRNAHGYEAGDYFFFTFPAISNENHPFSVTDAPDNHLAERTADGKNERNQHRMVLTVRKLGDYTKHLADLPVGSEVGAEGPFGRFADDIERCIASDKPVVLVGMGTGIAPLLSLAEEYRTRLPIHVIWTVRAGSEAYFDHEFRNMRDDDEIRYDMQVGRLTDEQIPRLLSKTELKEATFFVVGPARGVIDVEHMLHAQGVARQRLVDERLTM
ncbi:hypothetical protein [Bifidobacterium bombi]|uniref:Oxidoreductase n=1 Tax=Bifidobacterium bombi DSM 19703 TaxID=1341695 RepID=A0A086BPB7_9BIFI|nr:hypothetical protein [Bifidobacterium bombi]KFF31781.1 oxidoreductase [Bifidobacterium bombi DSM 19703]